MVELKHRSKVLNDTNSHGAMPWTTMGLAIAMGCDKAERDAVIDGLELRPLSHVDGGWTQHKISRQEKAEHTLAARIRCVLPAQRSSVSLMCFRWDATTHGPGFCAVWVLQLGQYCRP